MKTHFVSLLEHLCDECGKGFAQRISLEEHKFKHGTAVKKCPKCSFESTPPQVYAHIRRQHVERELLSCRICSSKFRSLTSLMKHTGTFHEHFPLNLMYYNTYDNNLYARQILNVIIFCLTRTSRNTHTYRK